MFLLPGASSAVRIQGLRGRKVEPFRAPSVQSTCWNFNGFQRRNNNSIKNRPGPLMLLTKKGGVGAKGPLSFLSQMKDPSSGNWRCPRLPQSGRGTACSKVSEHPSASPFSVDVGTSVLSLTKRFQTEKNQDKSSLAQAGWNHILQLGLEAHGW